MHCSDDPVMTQLLSAYCASSSFAGCAMVSAYLLSMITTHAYVSCTWSSTRDASSPSHAWSREMRVLSSGSRNFTAASSEASPPPAGAESAAGLTVCRCLRSEVALGAVRATASSLMERSYCQLRAWDLMPSLLAARQTCGDRSRVRQAAS